MTKIIDIKKGLNEARGPNFDDLKFKPTKENNAANGIVIIGTIVIPNPISLLSPTKILPDKSPNLLKMYQ